MKNTEEKILDLLDKKSPMPFREIAKEAGISYATCARELAKLCQEDKTVEIQGQSGRLYYIPNRKATYEDISNMHIEMAKDTVDAKDSYEVLSNDMAKMKENINGLYANLISIIAVFVAIFALITVNANIAFKLTKENMCGVFSGIIAVNIFVVVCIIALLIATRLIIINPIIKGKKKK
ncbi:winged helix-turn-helix transcriptional regulator [Roseburia faecis]|uniref:winged helix-turn-helix transcriptional regulator n=1 Tax=Roseburia faecis TaxID=301302 RepID=UPI003F9BEB8B